MALNCTVLTSGYSATPGTVFTTASISPAANALIEIEILSGDGGADARVPDSVTGAGLNFDNVVGVLNDGTYNFLNKRRALSASPSSGVITITFPITHEACGWIIKEWTGVDTSGTNGSGAIVQSASNFQNTPLVTAGSVTLASFGSANNAASACFAVNKIGAITQEAGYTELADFEIVGWDTRLESEWKIGEDTSPSCSWDVAGKYGGLAVEIKADTVAPILTSPTVTPHQIGHQGGQPKVTTNEANGTAYVVVVPNNDTPSVAQIKAGQNSSGGAALYAESKAVSAVGVIGFGLMVELSPSTAYDVWFVHTDAAANDSTAVKYDLTTTARAVSKNGTFEFGIRNTGSYTNKLVDVTLNVTFTKPDLSTIVFWGFFDGDGLGGGAYNSGNIWKFRCLGLDVGTWGFDWEFSDLVLSGSGSFTVNDDAGNLPGKIDAYATNPHWFERDGAPLFLKSFYIDAGGLLGQPADWLGTNIYQKLVNDGYNHLMLQGLLPIDWLDAYATDGTPPPSGALWLDSNITQTWRFDWMRTAEDSLRWLGSAGVSAHMFQGFDANGHAVTRWGNLTSGEKDWYARNIVARLAPFANIAGWNFCYEVDLEVLMTQGFELMDRLVTYDKFSHLRGLHEESPYTNSFSDSRITMALYENHYSLGVTDAADALPPSHNDAALISYAGKPPFCHEGNGLFRWWLQGKGYTETQMDDLYPRNAWATVMGGASFTWEDHGGLTLTSSTIYGRATPIARIKYLHDILSTEVEWYKMAPNNGLLSSFTGNAYCLAEVGLQYLVYRDSNGAFDLTIANGMAWVGEWVDIRTNNRSSAGSGTGGGTPVTFTPPASPTTEWVLKVTVNGPTYTQAVSGALTFLGTHSKSANKVVGGSLSYSSGVIKTTYKNLSSALSFIGGVVKVIAKNVAGSLTPSGALTAAALKLKVIDGALTFASSVTKTTNKILSGVLTFAGSTIKLTSIILSGSLSLAGAVGTLKVFVKSIAGTLSFGSGSLLKLANKALSGELTFTGSMLRNSFKILSGALSFSGAASALKTMLKTVSGTLSFSSGTITKIVGKAFSGSISFAGAVMKSTSKVFSGTLSFIGSASKQTYKIIGGVLSFIGSVFVEAGSAAANLSRMVVASMRIRVILADERLRKIIASMRIRS